MYDADTIIERLNEEIEFLEQELFKEDDGEEQDLENPDYAYYTLQVLYNIRGDKKGLL